MVCPLSIHASIHLTRSSAACKVGLDSASIQMAPWVTHIYSSSERGYERRRNQRTSVSSSKSGNPRSRHTISVSALVNHSSDRHGHHRTELAQNCGSGHLENHPGATYSYLSLPLFSSIPRYSEEQIRHDLNSCFWDHTALTFSTEDLMGWPRGTHAYDTDGLFNGQNTRQIVRTA